MCRISAHVDRVDCTVYVGLRPNYGIIGSCGYSVTLCSKEVVHALVLVGVASNIKINCLPRVFPVHQ